MWDGNRWVADENNVNMLRLAGESCERLWHDIGKLLASGEGRAIVEGTDEDWASDGRSTDAAERFQVGGDRSNDRHSFKQAGPPANVV